MNDIVTLMGQLDAMGVKVALRDGALTTRAAPGTITPEIATAIREQRDALISFIRRRETRMALHRTPIVASGAASYPPSYAQQRLWLLDRMGQGGAAYHVPLLLRIEGRLDIDAVESAFAAIVARHAVLRTVVCEVDGAPVCKVTDQARCALRRLVLPRGSALAPLVREECARRFDLAADLMLRVTLVEVGPQSNVLLFVMHHIATDGWSINILVREFAQLYQACSSGTAAPLEPLPVQYADYAAWQQRWVDGGALEQELAYWTRRLEGMPQLHAVPTDYPRPPVQRYQGSQHVGVIERAAGERLRALCSEHAATPFIGLQLAFAILLGRWSNQNDICFGTPIANRMRPELEGLVGFFVNTLVLRNRIDEARPFRAMLAETALLVAADYDHQNVPFDLVVERLNPERSASHAPLVQIMFSLQNQASGTVYLDGLSLSHLEEGEVAAKFDLTLNINEQDGVFHTSLQYSTALFAPATVARMAEQYVALVAAIANAPDVPVRTLNMLGPQEEAQLAAVAYGPQRAYPASSIPHVLREQAVLHGERCALSDGGIELSYAQLDTRAASIAAALMARGVRDEQPVGICMERGIDMVVAMLAVLQTGAMYVPLDLTMPAERMALILTDSACDLVLCGAAQQAAVAALGVSAPTLAELEDCVPTQRHLPAPRAGRRLAYLMYTSGSSGQPKGVLVEQRGVLRLVCNTDYVQIGASDTVAQASNSAFDAATFEVWGALLNGARLHFIDSATLLDPYQLEAVLAQQRVSVMFMTTSLFNQTAAANPRGFGGLSYLVIGGEAIDARAVATVLEGGAPPRHLVNGYGPTENTTFSATFEMKLVAPSYPIGRPLANSSCHILGDGGQLLPYGAVGDLYTGGAGVARGYLNRPTLNAERFIPDPFSDEQGARLYRTGDLARWLPDGTLDYLGRNDFQVKIRGFRIELGEIEAALRNLPGVREAVVLVHGEGGTQSLVAYLSAEPDAELDGEAVRAALRSRLPEYMVPARYVMLAALPLTANGKLDRKALPAPDAQASLAAPFTPPEGEAEQALAALWLQLLPVDRVGRDDNFFDLGGHSLLAVQLCARVRQTVGRELAVRDVLECRTVRVLAARLSGTGLAAHAITADQRGAVLPLSWAQQRLWFIDQLEPGASAYNMPAAVRLRGSLDVVLLEQALQAIVQRHESLRTSFSEVDGVAQQHIASDCPLALEHIDLCALAPDEREAQARQLAAAEARLPFDLRAGGLIRGKLLVLGADEHILLIMMHHIISDGWSLSVLMREFGQLYSALSDGRSAELTPLPIQYADYALWQRSPAQAGQQQAHLAFWTALLEGAPALLELPTDRPRPPVQSNRGASIEFTLGSGLSTRLAAWSRRHDATLFMTLYAGFSLLISRLSGQEDVVIGIPVANRQHAELEGLIGFFVNTLAFRTTHDGADSAASLVTRVRDMAVAAFSHQELPFEHLVEAIQPPRSLSHNAVFQVMFSLQNTPHTAIELPGLKLSGQPGVASTAQFDLSLSVEETATGIVGEFNYANELFNHSTVSRWVDHYRTLLGAMVDDPERPCAALPLMDRPAQDALLATFAGQSVPEHPNALLHQLFESQVAATPDAVAVEHDGVRLSYAELNTTANRLAHHLRRAGALPDTLVAVAAQRSIGLVIAQMAVLKSGAAYVPLDPSYPAERLAYMLNDCAPLVLLTQGVDTTTLATPPGRTLARFDLVADACLWSGEDGRNLEIAPGQSGQSLAYVMYTSGSTGRPKGVMIEHRSVVSYLSTFCSHLGVGSSDRTLQFVSVSFDAALQDVFGTLTTGATLVLRTDAWLTTPEQFWNLCQVHAITCMDLPTQFWAELALSGAAPASCVRNVIIGGEAASEQALGAWLRAAARPRLFNTYGPTEATVSATMLEVSAGADWRSIGRPWPRVRTYVLDALRQPVPPGVRGEIYIGGVQVARGYLNQPALTDERFMPDPFSTAPGARMYGTGDMACWLSDGSLAYLGRDDAQVKIRGFRIELSEIENCLSQAPGVLKAVVQVRKDGLQQILVAYLRQSRALTAEQLREHALRYLPAYMVPAAYVSVDAWPLTPSGKLDRKALPAPMAQAYVHSTYDPPRGAIEQGVAELWADLLKVERVGRDDNFFDLGGHSLLAIRMVAELRSLLGRELSVASVFAYQTVAALASMLDSKQKPALQSAPEAGAMHVTPVRGARDGMALFCLPGLFASTLEYQSITAALCEERAVHGFICHTLSAQRWECWSMAQLAALYAECIRASVTGGPVALLGWSVGGDLAFEVARLLQPSHQVAFLGLVDVHTPPETELSIEPAMLGADQTDPLANYVGASTMNGRWSELWSRLDDAERQLLSAHFRAAGPSFPLDGEEPQAHEYRTWARINHAAMMRRHSWHPGDVPVHVWHAGDSDPGSLRDWSALAPVHQCGVICGTDHRSVLDNPQLLQQLHSCLAHADRRFTSAAAE